MGGKGCQLIWDLPQMLWAVVLPWRAFWPHAGQWGELQGWEQFLNPAALWWEAVVEVHN